MEDKNRFCVYLHKDADGIVRYVGEGTIDRAYTKSRKDQPTWMAVFGKVLPTVEIVAKDMSKESAEFLELKVRDFHSETIINNPYATKTPHKIDAEYVLKFVSYDETSPTFLRWNNAMKNNAKAGSSAGSIPKKEQKKKYCTLEIEGVSYGVHRIVWTIHNGEIPSDLFVDHIDGDKTNNSVQNLRLVNAKHNSHNRLGVIPASGYRNIQESYYNNRLTGYMIRWNERDNRKRLNKSFGITGFTQEEALYSCYEFRDSLIERGCISPRVKEGEIPLLNPKETINE